MRRCRWFFTALLAVTAPACRDNDMRSYRVAPEFSSDRPVAAPMGDGPTFAPAVSAEGPREVTWTLPKGWTEASGSAMRYATLTVPGLDGRSAELSVIALGPEAGEVLPNVNRWREQLGLDPVAAADLGSQVEKMTVAGRPMTLVNLVSEENLIDGSLKKRMLAAFFSAKGRVWFFKMTGDDVTVQNAVPAFRKFLDSLRGL